MAGGAGTRFWPLSTEEKPKQFLDILGTGKTFIQMTVDRFEKIIPAENIYIITNEKYKALVQSQLPSLHENQIICEPSRNNTAPCILLAALKIGKQDPDACCLFVPSDHLIIDTEQFQNNAMAALEFAYHHKAIVTIGIIPNRPETGYGYIKFDPQHKDQIKKVEKFVEKPNLETAKNYIESGEYLWNAGMFAWHYATILDQYKKLSNQMYRILSNGLEELNTKDESDFLKENYSKTENISVDFAIMEKSDCVYTLPAGFDWSDLGIWSSVYEVSPKDENQNVIIGNSDVFEDNQHNLVILPHKKRAIIRGLKEYIVVDSGDALLIYPKLEEHNIKSSQAKLNK